VEGEPEFAQQKRASDAVVYLTNHRTLTTELQTVETELKIRQHYTTDDPRLSDQVTYHYGIVNLADAWDYTAGDPDVVVQVYKLKMIDDFCEACPKLTSLFIFLAHITSR